MKRGERRFKHSTFNKEMKCVPKTQSSGGQSLQTFPYLQNLDFINNYLYTCINRYLYI